MKRLKKHPSKLKSFRYIAGGLLMGMMFGLIWNSALAAPISPTTSTRAAAYQGVVTVIPGNTGDTILELGATGQDIAGSGDIYLRPSSLASTVSIRLRNVTGKTDLEVQGKVCLNGSCRDTWPTGGGSNTWELVGSRLIPVTRAYGVSVRGTPTTDPAVTVTANNSDAAVFVSNTSAGASASALKVNDGFYTDIFGDLLINSSGPCPLGGTTCPLTVYNPCTFVFPFRPCVPGFQKVWYRENDGATSTLNAGILDAIDVKTYSSSPLCNGVDDQCLCGTLLGASGFNEYCVALFDPL